MTVLLFCAFAAANPFIMEALETELDRQQEGYFIAYDVMDGTITSIQSEDGGLLFLASAPFRNLRAEIRVGNSDFDSSNTHIPEGVVIRPLPVDNNITALRREIWLASNDALNGAKRQLSVKAGAMDDLPDLVPIQGIIDLDGKALPVVKDDLVILIRTIEEQLDGLDTVVMARDWQGTRITVTSEGTRIISSTGFLVIRVEAGITLDDGQKVFSSRSWVTRSGLPDLDLIKKDTASLRNWLINSNNAISPEHYLGPVLFGPQASLELLRQLVHPEILGTPGIMALKPPQLGARLLPEGWNVEDIPGSYEYDHEGIEPIPVLLVENGIVINQLQSRIPSSHKHESTGHGRSRGKGRREAIPAKILIKPPKQYPQTKLEKRALRLAKQIGQNQVLYIERLEPLQRSRARVEEDGISEPTEAWLIGPNGKIPVKNLRFTKVDRRSLRDIVAAGQNSPFTAELDAGRELRDRLTIGPLGGLTVYWSVPTLLINELELRQSERFLFF